jgi:hypothetical protein
MNWINEHTNIVKNDSLNKKKQRQFGFLLVAIVVLILGISFYKNGFVFINKHQLLIGFIGIFTLITLIFPKFFVPFLFIWLIFGVLIGEISSFIILGLIYFLIFSPITIVIKLFKKKSNENPKWINKNEASNYEKMY